MLIHLPIVILAALPFTPVADNVPKFDIARECRAEGGSQGTQEKCAADEMEARNQLQSLWLQSSGPNLTFRFGWGFPEELACASLGYARANEHPVEPSRP